MQAYISTIFSYLLALPAGTRLLALGHVTDHERKTLHIRGDGTFSMTLSPGPRGRPLLTYLLEMPFAGRFHVPQGRLTALDAPSLISIPPEVNTVFPGCGSEPVSTNPGPDGPTLRALPA